MAPGIKLACASQRATDPNHARVARVELPLPDEIRKCSEPLNLSGIDLGNLGLSMVYSCVCNLSTTAYAWQNWRNPHISNRQTWPRPLHS